MQIFVAGAGSGKTTNMAKRIIELREKIDSNKTIYCVAFTNNAVNCIKNKLIEHYCFLPDNIIVSTIHSFLYKEFIRPYYYILYNKQFTEISTSKLPNDVAYKNSKIKRLEEKNILHQSVIPEKAKWVVFKKSTDNSSIKAKRKVIIKKFIEYCGAICVDEAQDIDSLMMSIFNELDRNGVNIILMGDPKQDLKGSQCFRKLINERPNEVEYLKQCFRCPQCHIIISNRIISKEERQYSNKTTGMINLYFESDIGCNELLMNRHYDLKYISFKQDKFYTHKEETNLLLDPTLSEELELVFSSISTKSSIVIKRMACYYALRLIETTEKLKDKRKAMKKVFKGLQLETNQYASIINAIPEKVIKDDTNKIYIDSIDNVKGQEGDNCLFILTPDLARYLFDKDAQDNKTKNRTYVALTRSLNVLDIYVTQKTEDKYSKNEIIEFFYASEHNG